MHTMDGNTSNVPAFITKLWKLVEDHNYDHLIQWNQNGRSFIIHDQSKFAKELLPLYFKHSNMASFIRQLNMYGFRKVSNIENSGLRAERDDIEFYNQHFIKGQEYALERIKRKTSSQIPTVKAVPDSGALKHEDFSEILTDVESIRGRQDSVDSLLTNMQRENEALWREVAILRQKHHKQQQIVEKLIQFLVSLVQNRGLLGIKRKAQLMIDHSEGGNKKISKTNECDFTSGSYGPIIHDVTDDFDENASSNSPIFSNALNIAELSPNSQVLVQETDNSPKNDLSTNSSEQIETLDILDPLQESIKELGLVADEQNVNEPNVENTLSVDSLLRSSLNTPPGSPSNIFDNQSTNTTESNSNVKDLVVSTQNDDQRLNSLNPNLLSDHVDGIEAELDWLQDQLSAGGLNIDSSTLLGVGLGLGLNENALLQKLFSIDDPSSLSTPSNSLPNKLNNNDIIGNEVVQFNPNNTNLLFDDLDLDDIDPTDDNQESDKMEKP